MSADNNFAWHHDGRLEVSGALTFETVPEFFARSRTWFGAGDTPVTIDLHGVTRADSAGLALMVEWLRLARGTGQKLHFANIPQQITHLIRVNGLQQAFAANSDS